MISPFPQLKIRVAVLELIRQAHQRQDHVALGVALHEHIELLVGQLQCANNRAVVPLRRAAIEELDGRKLQPVVEAIIENLAGSLYHRIRGTARSPREINQ